MYNRNEKIAFDLGYRINEDGEVLNPKNKVLKTSLMVIQSLIYVIKVIIKELKYIDYRHIKNLEKIFIKKIWRLGI